MGPTRTLGALLLTGLTAVAASAQTATAPQAYRGLEVSVTGIERAPNARLNDCPAGANVVNATTRPGEQFAIVTVAFKVLPGFQPAAFKRPSVTDTDGKTFNTAASFVDVGSVPQFTCMFPFRVPENTRLKTFQIETLSIDISAVGGAKP